MGKIFFVADKNDGLGAGGKCLRQRLVIVSSAVLMTVCGSGIARAQNVLQSSDIAKPVFSKAWFGDVQTHIEFQGGITLNPDVGVDGINFGRLYTDRANIPLFNGALLTVKRPVNKKADYDIGFGFQAVYGSDGRTTHFLGQFDKAIDARNQLTILEASVSMHLPWLTPMGMEVKAGEYPTPLGFEAKDPIINPFYSHSYIYNGPGTSRHMGAVSTIHISPELDLWLGIDSGNGTTLWRNGDNNTAASGIFGFGLNNLLDGKLSVLALSHIGPETSLTKTPDANQYMRYYNDAFATYQVNDKLSLTTEVDYTKDDYADAEGYGFAQYISYALTDTITLNARGEVFWDPQGFWMVTFQNNQDYVNLLAGLPSTTLFGPPSTYGEITLGATYKPKLKDMDLLIRPELRYETSLSGAKPFNDYRSKDMFTPAVDVIVRY